MDTIFYSWQSDTYTKINRNFIRDALEKAIKKVAESLDLNEAPRLDQDTSGVPGSPEIADTILKKIEDCVVFVPDLTIVAHTDDKEPTPNPNVMIEYGYALKTIGPERIIPVMNEFFGDAEHSLPFDLSHRRWPIRYNLKEDAAAEERKEQKEYLVKQIREALETIIKAGLLNREPENPIVLNSSTYMVPPLSREAQLLLKEASMDNQGIIIYSRTSGGTSFITNSKNLITNQTPREVAKWKAAFNELVMNELIQDVGNKGEVFELTAQGYNVADTITL